MGKTTTSLTDASSSRSSTIVSQQLTINASTQELQQGLQRIETIFYDPSRQAYIIESAAGRVAVNLDDQPPSLTHSGQLSDQDLQAAYALALGQQATHAPLSAADNVLQLGDLRDKLAELDVQLKNHDNPGGPEYLQLVQQREDLNAQYAALAQELMAEEVAVCQQDVADIPSSGPVSRRVEMKRRAQHMGQKLRSFIRGQNRRQATAAQALLFGTDEDGEAQLPEDKFEESRQAALALGGEHLIPESKLDFEARETGETDDDGNPITEIVSTGEVHANQDYRDAMELFQSRVVNGGVRLVVLSGPPSTGKDTFAEQMSALLGMPVVTKNMGPGYDISDALGGEGLGPVDTFDQEGNQTGTVAGSRRIVGSLTEAAQHRAAFIMTEIEGMEDDLVRLNTLFGSRVGEPDKRTVSAGSISDDDEIVPHEDFMVFITYNPGHDDIKLPSSVNNRALNLSFEYAPPEEEAEIVSKMATAIAKQDTVVDGLDQREIKPEEVRPVVDLIRRFRNLHATDPQIWKDQPDMRQAAHIFHDLVHLGHQGNSDALGATVRRTLSFTLPGSMEMPISERDSRLDDIIKDYENELNSIVHLGYNMRADAQQQKE